MILPLARSLNWRRETGEPGTWPYDLMWEEHKAQEWRSDRLRWELIDMLNTVKSSDRRLVESMRDRLSVSDGNLTLVVILGAPEMAKKRRA